MSHCRCHHIHLHWTLMACERREEVELNCLACHKKGENIGCWWYGKRRQQPGEGGGKKSINFFLYYRHYNGLRILLPLQKLPINIFSYISTAYNNKQGERAERVNNNYEGNLKFKFFYHVWLSYFWEILIKKAQQENCMYVGGKVAGKIIMNSLVREAKWMENCFPSNKILSTL